MTSYIRNELNGLAFEARQPGGTLVEEAVVKKRGWYLYHENSLSGQNAANLGHNRELMCFVDASKPKRLKDFIKKS